MSNPWLLLFGSFALIGGLAIAQSEAGAKRKQEANLVFVGVSNCAGCHSSKAPTEFAKDFVLLTEYDIWHEKDKHSQAFEVLNHPLGKKIGTILGYEPAKKDACLNCHTVNVPPERQGSHFRLQDGVSCEACHGPAKKWLGEHQEHSWRLKTGSDKEALGMIDVRNPITQTNVCLSCHLGDAAQGRILTHEMLAAGHPPLPGFEITAFRRFMPPHWRLAKEVPFLKEPRLDKPPAKFKDPQVLKEHVHNLYQFQLADFEQTRLVVLSGPAVFKSSMDLLAAQAKAVNAKQGVLDLAVFNCSSCHHELKKQHQGTGNAPGRPRLPTAPGILLPLVLRHTAGADQQNYAGLAKEYANQIQVLHEALAARPFGDARRIALATEKLATWTSKFQNQTAKAGWDRQSARRLLDALASLSQQKTLDYDSARQIVWAYKTIQEEIFPEEAKRHVSTWKTLDRRLRLEIRPGKYLVEDHLIEALARMSHFDPAAFAKKFAAIHEP